MGDGIAKKRKRNGAEAVANATAFSKKSKKVKNAPPKIEPEEDESESGENDDLSEEQNEQQTRRTAAMRRKALSLRMRRKKMPTIQLEIFPPTVLLYCPRLLSRICLTN
ncbi:ATP-dependent RNA helicase [Metarhizium acridum]|nr:ATP-dependent RNA helicase [Metarhizium acridum]